MKRTIKLEGHQLEAALAIKEAADHINRGSEALSRQLQDFQNAGHRRINRMVEDLKLELGLAPEAHSHIDLDYLQEHGLVFVRTGCEEDAGGVQSVLQTLFGQGSINSGGLN